MNLWFIISIFGSPELWLLFLFLLLVFYFALGNKLKHKKFVAVFLLVAFTSLLVSLGVVEVLKIGLNIPRPCVVCTPSVSTCNPYCESSPSFPSGHAATSAVVAASIYLIYRKRKYITSVFAFPVVVDFSRVFLGVHTYLDVIAGSLVALAISCIIWKIIKVREK